MQSVSREHQLNAQRLISYLCQFKEKEILVYSAKLLYETNRDIFCEQSKFRTSESPPHILVEGFPVQLCGIKETLTLKARTFVHKESQLSKQIDCSYSSVHKDSFKVERKFRFRNKNSQRHETLYFSLNTKRAFFGSVHTRNTWCQKSVKLVLGQKLSKERSVHNILCLPRKIVTEISRAERENMGNFCELPFVLFKQIIEFLGNWKLVLLLSSLSRGFYFYYNKAELWKSSIQVVRVDTCQNFCPEKFLFFVSKEFRKGEKEHTLLRNSELAFFPLLCLPEAIIAGKKTDFLERVCFRRIKGDSSTYSISFAQLSNKQQSFMLKSWKMEISRTTRNWNEKPKRYSFHKEVRLGEGELHLDLFDEIGVPIPKEKERKVTPFFPGKSKKDK